MDLVKPFFIGGAVIAGSKAVSKIAPPALSPLIGGMPTGIIATFFLDNDKEKLVDISAPASLTFFIKLKSPQTLQTVTSKLKSINFIEDYSIEELSTSLAKVKIRYLGKIKNVQDSFYENGFEFQIKDEEWVLSLPG